MKFHVDGEEFEIPDTDVRAYVEALDAVDEDAEIEIVPPNKYIFGIHVNHTGELDKMGKDIRSFMDTVGEGEIEVQVSVNAKLAEFKDKVVGFDVSHLEPAIGDIEMTEDDYEDEDWEDWDDDEEAKGTNQKVIRARKGSDIRKRR